MGGNLTIGLEGSTATCGLVTLDVVGERTVSISTSRASDERRL